MFITLSFPLEAFQTFSYLLLSPPSWNPSNVSSPGQKCVSHLWCHSDYRKGTLAIYWNFDRLPSYLFQRGTWVNWQPATGAITFVTPVGNHQLGCSYSQCSRTAKKPSSVHARALATLTSTSVTTWITQTELPKYPPIFSLPSEWLRIFQCSPRVLFGSSDYQRALYSQTYFFPDLGGWETLTPWTHTLEYREYAEVTVNK